ncbi:UDP-glucuronosyltransferase 2B7-like [Nematostella vectensis]|uniref:UDP-glucuronosyltransferase 2B7-like n=1 Tax=Nematostella vectensis TaxID=45351 RepID=UPI002076ED97|nr:UDP-glucuronosyltransferase 2B7-like [Nematostella vectensis]
MAFFHTVLVFVVVFYAQLQTECSNGAKIVGYSMMGGSQYIGMKKIAQELVARGHEVTLLVSSIQKTDPSGSKGVRHAVYNVPVEPNHMEMAVQRTIKYGVKQMLGITSKLFCESTLDAVDVLEPMKAFDLILTDCTMLCGLIVAEYLNLTRVEYCPVTPRLPFMYYKDAPMFPSHVPLMKSQNPGQMSFLQRLRNTLVYFATHAGYKFVLQPVFEDIKQKYNITPERTYAESLGREEMTLFLADPALEYIFPLLPGHKLIGPVTVSPPKPLPRNLQKVIDSSDGVVIVSFGSNILSSLPRKDIDVLAEAFGQLKETVFWRIKGYIPANLSPNIKTVEWLPQNDLLANQKTRVLVSHLGQNSLYESSYHGIPLVGVPLCADQFDNAVLAEDRGLGLSVDINTVTADQLYRTIRRVVDEPRFKENAARISRLMQDRRRSPTEEAADWIEYTLRHRRLTHLRPASVHLIWYQYFLLDVMLYMGVVLLSVAMVIRLVYKLVCSCCCRKKKAKTQ